MSCSATRETLLHEWNTSSAYNFTKLLQSAQALCISTFSIEGLAYSCCGLLQWWENSCLPRKLDTLLPYLNSIVSVWLEFLLSQARPAIGIPYDSFKIQARQHLVDEWEFIGVIQKDLLLLVLMLPRVDDWLKASLRNLCVVQHIETVAWEKQMEEELPCLGGLRCMKATHLSASWSSEAFRTVLIAKRLLSLM